MQSRRVPRAKSKQGSMSPAQFHNAMDTRQPTGRPANRLNKPAPAWPGGSYDYNQYENTSRSPRHNDDVILPPVNKTPVWRASASPRRPARRVIRKLPRVRTKTNEKRPALYHSDGEINLQALNDLSKKQSFPRTKSYFDRLQNIGKRLWPNGGKRETSSPDDYDDRVIPLQFLDDEHLTPRKRAERDSFLATLLNADDLTDDELNKIAHYFISDDPDQESRPSSSCLRKRGKKKQRGSPRPKSAPERNERRENKGIQESQGPKSVRFSNSSPFLAPVTAASMSPRPNSTPASLIRRRSSDPFHVPSPLASPRLLCSPDEIAVLSRADSPSSEIPESPDPEDDDVAYITREECPSEISELSELIPEPEVTYYDDSGEEIDEEIQQKNQASGEDNKTQRKPAFADTKNPASAAESPRSEASSSGGSTVGDHLPDEEDTPRVELEQTSPEINRRSETPASDSGSPEPRGLSDDSSSDSPRRSESPSPQTPKGKDGSTSTRDKDALTPRSDKEISGSAEEASPISNQVPSNRKQDSTQTDPPSRSSRPNKESPGILKKSRPKSSKSKRKKSSSRRHRSKSSERSKSAERHRSKSREGEKAEPNLDQETGKNFDPSSQVQDKVKETTKTGGKAAEGAETESEQETPPAETVKRDEGPKLIPVISVTRGRLPAVLIQPPAPQEDESKLLAEEIRAQPKGKIRSGSMNVEFSPRTAVDDLDSSFGIFVDTDEKQRRRKDNRMKIWLTKINWDGHVECVD